MKKILIIGGGFAGCCAAHVLTGHGFDITLVERDSYLGGGVKTHWYGGHPFTYGPRHFLSYDENLFAFLNQHVPLRRMTLEHENYTYVERDQQFYLWPPHESDVERMPDADTVREELKNLPSVANVNNFEEKWLGSVGRTLYSKFAESYSKKMWQIESNAVLDGVEFAAEGQLTGPLARLRSGPHAPWANEGVISAFPIAPNGYDDYFPLATRGVNVLLNTQIEAFDVENYRAKLAGEWRTYDIIISTISPEILMNGVYGKLRWMGREFWKIVLPVEQVFPDNVIFLYYANAEPFTRIVEYKKFYLNKSPSTLLGLEIPSIRNQLYPFPARLDQERARQYLSAMPDRVFSIGRMGTYRYIDIDDTIAQCLDLKKKLV